jgi:hypothetical protein
VAEAVVDRDTEAEAAQVGTGQEAAAAGVGGDAAAAAGCADTAAAPAEYSYGLSCDVPEAGNT